MGYYKLNPNRFSQRPFIIYTIKSIEKRAKGGYNIANEFNLYIHSLFGYS